MNKFGKFILALVLLVGGSIGLGLSLCGAFFTVTGLQDAEILIMSLPSAVVGLLLLYVVVKQFRKVFGKKNGSVTDDAK